MGSPRPRKPNQNALLDFRPIHDDAWYTVDTLVISKEDTTLTVRFNDFDEDNDEEFNMIFINRFRPACVQLQDEECKNAKRFWFVCALLQQGEDDHKFYIAFIESVTCLTYRFISCSCAFLVCWLEGPKDGKTEQMQLERICKVQLGYPLFDHALLDSPCLY
ncbi:hypothetical protein MKW98_004527 [Papaver atlanticum]|uniref:SAWADEE domain-containing protein n=1 Tax=Papaver atlanticum TaxID=357466 RepID=A0AAD4SPE0_9MAGN|nr:hypothetical protein MKW98_004527 [Papaver atlanticum]